MNELVCEVCLRQVTGDEAVYAHRDLDGKREDLGFGPRWSAATPCHAACRPSLLRNPNWQVCSAPAA